MANRGFFVSGQCELEAFFCLVPLPSFLIEPESWKENEEESIVEHTDLAYVCICVCFNGAFGSRPPTLKF
jgi:hypothetical protein